MLLFMCSLRGSRAKQVITHPQLVHSTTEASGKNAIHTTEYCRRSRGIRNAFHMVLRWRHKLVLLDRSSFCDLKKNILDRRLSAKDQGWIAFLHHLGPFLIHIVGD